MIFVTVGTHEQQFDRLISEIDRLKKNGIIEDDIFIQTGYSTYAPQYCEFANLITYDKMIDMVNRARIIITHGGPASFVMPLKMGKVPIVVPRQKRYNEHINDHQVEFALAVKERNKNIITVMNIDDLGETIRLYDDLVSKESMCMKSNNINFCNNLDKMIANLLGETNG